MTTQLARKGLLVLSQAAALPALLATSPAVLAASDSAVNEAQRWGLNMPVGVTAVSREIFDLHMLIFWICVAIGVVVFGVMFWSMLMHRKSNGVKPASFHESTLVEIAWTVVPFIILVLMAIPATSSLIKIYDTSEADLDIKVVGYQWKWQYEYLGQDVSFFSNLSTSQDEIYGRAPRGEHYLLEVDEPVVIPINKKVRFLITANDVLHAWWVPDLAVKRDAIPGYINDAWAIVEKPGIYRGQCAELCGKDHGFMPIVVHAMEEQDYNQWLAGKKKAAAEVAEMNKLQLSMEDMYARGEQVYNKSCAACHAVDGKGGVGPSMIGTTVTTGPIQTHVDVIVNGVQGTAMQAFGNQLSELDLAAVVTYERNAWGNNMGDMVQAVDVLNFKKGQ
ncbi:MAG: cytochrome c oxidase subunit II [Pseudomonadales bacterium]|nr:cytochrome c oxidase subunit II [Gammaproteobacteria bacterium]NNL56860.1 cytochrome c oxidase subunit II [Pseudomonadales bacterium]